MKYSTKISPLSIEGNTVNDKAFEIWSQMAPLERLEIMNAVGDYKSIAYKHRACINYIKENIIK